MEGYGWKFVRFVSSCLWASLLQRQRERGTAFSLWHTPSPCVPPVRQRASPPAPCLARVHVHRDAL